MLFFEVIANSFLLCVCVDQEEADPEAAGDGEIRESQEAERTEEVRQEGDPLPQHQNRFIYSFISNPL